MVSFNCEGCNDVVKKPKLDQHYYKCHAPVTCLDCNTQFSGPQDWKSHTTCISEAEKYEKSVYRGDKGGKGQKSETKRATEIAKKPADEEMTKIEEKVLEKESKKDKKRKADDDAVTPVALNHDNDTHFQYKKSKTGGVVPRSQQMSTARPYGGDQGWPQRVAPPAPILKVKKDKGSKYKAEKEKRLAKRQAREMGQLGQASDANNIPIKAKKWPQIAAADSSIIAVEKMLGGRSQGEDIRREPKAEGKKKLSKQERKKEKEARRELKKARRAERKQMSVADKEIVKQAPVVEIKELRPQAKVVDVESREANDKVRDEERKEKKDKKEMKEKKEKEEKKDEGKLVDKVAVEGSNKDDERKDKKKKRKAEFTKDTAAPSSADKEVLTEAKEKKEKKEKKGKREKKEKTAKSKEAPTSSEAMKV